MGESYLRKKLFSRMRRAKSISSSLHQHQHQQHSVDPFGRQRIPVASCSQQQPEPELTDFSPGDSKLAPSRELAESLPTRPPNSASTPQLATIREQQQQHEMQRAVAQEQPSSTRSALAASPTFAGDVREEKENESPTAAVSCLAATTAPTVTPTQAASTRPAPLRSASSGAGGVSNAAGTASGSKQTKGKLRSASRAIQFFRRTASSLTSSSSSGRLVSAGGGHISRQDTGDSGRSQQSSSTAGAGQTRPASSASSHAFGAFLCSSNATNTMTTTTTSSNGSGLHYNTSIANSKSNNSSEMLPQFIVPKLNALRLPLVCLIKSLEGELMREVFVHRYEIGQYLIESLKVSLGADDCKYFGLKLAKSSEEQEDLRNPWLDLNESVCKQIKTNTKLGLFQSSQASSSSSSNNSNINTSNTSNTNTNNNTGSNASASCSSATANGSSSSARSIEFYLRIKFYPPNLARVQDSFLRNYLWLQLRRDLRLGKLTSSMNNLTLLMACVLQFELGDCRQELLERVPELNILPNQDLIEEQASELWRTRLRGLKRHQAQMQFLRAAVILETYGFDYWPVRDHQRQRAYLLGFNYAGIKTIRNGRIVHHFRWHSLSKISYERRMIIFHIYPAENSKRKQILGFKCLSNEDCQNLYMRLLEQKYFFTVDLAYFDKSLRRPSCLYAQAASSNANHDTLDWFDEADPGERQSPNQSAQTIDNSNLAGQARRDSAPPAQADNNHAYSHRQAGQQEPASAGTRCPARCSAGCKFCADDEQQQAMVGNASQDSAFIDWPARQAQSANWSPVSTAGHQQQAAPSCQPDFRGQQQPAPASRRRLSRLHRQHSAMEYISSSDDDEREHRDAGDHAAPPRTSGSRACRDRHAADDERSHCDLTGTAFAGCSLWPPAAEKRLPVGAWLSNSIGRLQMQADSIGLWMQQVGESMLEQAHAALSAHCRQQRQLDAQEQGEQAQSGPQRMPMASDGDGEGGDTEDASDDVSFGDNEHQEQQPRHQLQRQRQRGGSSQLGSFDSLIRFCLLLLLLNFVIRVGESFWAALLELLAFGRGDERSLPMLVGDQPQIIDDDL